MLFGAGIAFYFALPSEPLLTVAVLPAVAALAIHAAGPRTGLMGLATGAMLAVTLGLAAAKLRTEIVRAPVLQARVGPIDIYGHVELVEPRAAEGQRLTVRVTAMEKHEAQAWPARVRVRMMAENAALKPGDPVHLRATLSPPPGPALPGDYDFARAAWFQGLGAVGYARSAARVEPNSAQPPLSLQVSAAIARVRQAIGRRVVAALPGETGAIANALITGERGGITETTNQAFRDSGLFHILSISGLHMVIMAGAVFLSIRLLLAAIPSIALRYPIKKWAAAGAMLGALGYLLISGAAFATVRSYIMISIMFLAVLLDRPALALRNVALAALLILVLWPESLLDAGFQMSFAAVVALVAAYEWLRVRDEARGRAQHRGVLGRAALFFGGIVTSTLVAGFAVAPFGVYHFHNTQQFAILANLLAIPACNLIVMPAGAGRAGGHAARAGGGAAVADGARHRGDGVVCQRGGAPARCRRPRAGHSDLRVRPDGCRRALVGALEHALAGAGGGAHRAGPDAGAHRASSRHADRARRRTGCRAGSRRQAVGARRPRLRLRAGALARA